MNDTVISCPKCRQPGILCSQRSVRSLIGSEHIAHVLHVWAGGNRHVCMLTRSEFQRILKTKTKRRTP
jgi:hypothetical protein